MADELTTLGDDLLCDGVAKGNLEIEQHGGDRVGLTEQSLHCLLHTNSSGCLVREGDIEATATNNTTAAAAATVRSLYGLHAETLPIHVNQIRALVRFFVSLGYIATMSLYMRLLREVVQNMSAPHAYARFLFQAQLYYYFFWYILISSAHDVDWLFWAMLIAQNIHYILTNTGVYEDIMSHFHLLYSRKFRLCLQP